MWRWRRPAVACRRGGCELRTTDQQRRELEGAALLLGCPRLLVAYDVDIEGEKGAERLRRLSPCMHRIRPPTSKDVTVFWQAGGRVRDWVRFELARVCAVLRRGERP